MQKRSELFFNLILLPVDFIAIVSAFVLAYAIRVKVDARPVHYPLGIHLFLSIFLLIVPVWILIFALSGMYNLSGLRGRLDELGRIFIAVSGGTMFMIVLDFLRPQPIFPAKSIPIYGYALSFGLVFLGRQIIRVIQRSLFSYGVGLHQAVLVGSGPLAQRIAEDIGSSPRSGYRIVGVIDSAKNAEKRMQPFRVFASMDEAVKAVGKDLDEIIQADSGLEPEEILGLVSFASNNHITYRFVPNQFGLYATNAVMGTLAGLPVIAIRKTPLDGWGRIVKRTFDIVGSLAGLILLAPVFLVVGLLIKFSDPGPVFYRHERVSRVGKKIRIVKFRSMYAKFSSGKEYSGKTVKEILADDLGKPELVEEFEKNHKLADDPRVTPIGKVLRSSSLDELPQLWNVLAGDISLVGPRPVTTEELQRYGEEVSTFLALKPGLTGLWQISGRSELSYEDRVKLDIYYVENWSLLLDIKILLKTAVTVALRRGAY